MRAKHSYFSAPCLKPLSYLATLLLLVMARPAHALDENSLFELDLQALSNLPVNIADRGDNTVARSASAATVITREQIRQSGMQTLPDLLRLVPGLHVGRIDSHKFWVAARGFGTRFNNKLQVMIDNRKLYTPLFSGTYWEQHFPVLEDIERIEVIRSSGGTLWGSNAMNGVINIVTRHSRDTADGLLVLAAGTEEMRQRAVVRQGWQQGAFSGRIYGQHYQQDEGQLTRNQQVLDAGLRPGDGAGDDWQHQLAGARLDWEIDPRGQTLSLSTEVYRADYDQNRLSGTVVTPDTLRDDGHFILLDYRLPIDDTQLLEVIAYNYQYDRRDGAFDEKRQIRDINIQYSAQLGRHHVTMGWNQQRSADETERVGVIFLNPADKTLDSTGLYLQNSLYFLAERLRITAGIRQDKNEYTEWESQPSFKVYYQWQPAHHFWASWSKSVTTPGRFNTESFLDLGTFEIPLGNPAQKPEQLHAWEAGYRYVRESFDLDLSLYKNRYSQINEAGFPPNGVQPDILGTELALRYKWSETLSGRLQYSFTNHRGPVRNPGQERGYGLYSVQHMLGLQLDWQFNELWAFHSGLYYNSNPNPYTRNGIFQSNTRLDMNVQYQFHPTIRLTLAGQNLLEEAESQTSDETRLNSGVERTFYVKLDWSWE